MSVAESPADLDRTLHERFNLERFRPGQREVIEQVLAGNDVLCVMPTGGGKSLCYQLPALVLSGVTLVVSPLIALMKDQVDALIARGIRATLINSSLELSEQNSRMAEVELGHYDLVYVAPERFASSRFIELMKRVKPSLLAVDEAHCVSEWGHDFRPDYARIGAARRALGMPPCIALTATATDLVRRDIAVGLDLQEPSQFITGFDRPNLTYQAQYLAKEAQKYQALGKVLERNPGSAIVYASSRKKCTEVGEYIQGSLNRPTVVYHAGMDREQRSEAQDRFMSGRVDIVVATNAFGMGVDKSDIRSVIHFNMPGTLEAYYQEAGRAGRDGHPSQCVLLHAPGDRYLQEMFIENEYPPVDAIHRIYEFLRGLNAEPIELTQAEISESSGVALHETAVGAALRILQDADALERFRPRENMAILRLQAIPEHVPISERVGANAHVQKLVAKAIEGLVNGRYGEAVYFQPDGFATMLGLDRSALTRALKHLSAEFPIDYVPPFRGNAIQIRDRSLMPRDLKIDFSSLNKRKKQEYEKLDRMLGYAQTRDCRRTFILDYFGDTDVTQCGRCDNCGTTERVRPAAETRSVDTLAGREILQKILSGVARAKGNYGRLVVSQMLLGSGSEKMERFRLTGLSTYGILAKSGFTRKEVTDVLDGLISAGLVSSDETDGFNPVIKLSDAGWAWIRDPEPAPVSLSLEPTILQKIRDGGLVRLRPEDTIPDNGDRELVKEKHPKPKRQVDVEGTWLASAKESSTPSAESVLGGPLWETLKALRLEWSRVAGVKAFQIFTNKVLDDLVKERPSTPQALVAIKGIGPATMERYGSLLLDAIRSGKANEKQLTGLDTSELHSSETKISRPNSVRPTTNSRVAVPSGTPIPTIVPSSVDLSTKKMRICPTEVGPIDGLLGHDTGIYHETSDRGETPNSIPELIAQPKSGVPTLPGSRVPTEEWTWQLLEKGFTLSEAASIRGIEISAIVRHTVWMVKKGRPFDANRILPSPVLSEWTQWLTTHGPDSDVPEPSELAPLWPLFVEFSR